MTNKQIEISMAEWDVMNVIWKKSPSSANDIVDEVQKFKDINEKTIRTLITRLYKKEMLTRYKTGNIYLYEPAVNEDNIKLKTTKKLLNKLYNGNMKSLLLNFTKHEELSHSEIEELRKILNDIDEK
jgi:BlaI family penicillinase repressor